ncbi:MAG: hypothetical protein CSB44_09160 [Gammaproteobacteria bacterium]|nr:MAG: hypothetical protein CSB44_09160 [Gammaproteobacteria bacterium]PIE36613.1 MAG: hypothetical protein CSA54_03970 [Gammaproteobacteria bacterium]
MTPVEKKCLHRYGGMYNRRVMVKQLPVRFNPDQLAADNSRFEAEIPFERFARLKALLAASPTGEVDGVVRASAMFSHRKDNVAVSGRLTTEFPLVCQRCLEPMVLPVDVSYELIFVADEAAAEALPEPLDPVVLDEHGHISQVDLFEDELMLAVPDYPRHGEGENCVDPEQSFGAVDAAVEHEQEGRQRPFEVLRDLDLN